MFESFYHAFHGTWIGLKEERNLRTHFAAAAAAGALGAFLRIDRESWFMLVFAITLVLVTEFLNTALEHLVDLSAEGKYYQSARYAKDTAAAAVLCASVGALIIGCMVFLPRLIAVFGGWTGAN